jgi:hypothetical protein
MHRDPPVSTATIPNPIAATASPTPGMIQHSGKIAHCPVAREQSRRLFDIVDPNESARASRAECRLRPPVMPLLSINREGDGKSLNTNGNMAHGDVETLPEQGKKKISPRNRA